MENLTGGTPPVRPLPCVVPCKLYFGFGYKNVRINKALLLEEGQCLILIG